MRRYGMMALSGLAAFAALAAQPAAAQGRLGIRAGVNFAELSGDAVDEDAVEMRTGLLAGLFYEAPVADIVNLHLGAQYTQKGFKTQTVAGNATFKLDYVEVPLLLAVVVPGSGTTDIRFYLGPSFAFRVKCEGALAGVSSNCNDSDDIKKFDVGGDVGAGVKLGLSGGSALLIDGFYDFGFTSIDGSSDPADVKNEVWSLTAGLMFPAGD